MNRRRFAITLLGLCPGVVGAGEGETDPAAVAGAFYDRLRARRVSGLPRGEDWAALEPLVSEKLAAAIRRAQREQAEHLRDHPDEKPPWIEGDLFSSLFEGSQTHRVGKVEVAGDTATVAVAFTHREGGHTAAWTDTLVLRRVGKAWKVEDLRYGGTWDFASRGTLLEGLVPVKE